MEERSREGRDLTSVAEILAAGDPLVWRRLLAEHTADDLGHCRCCRRDRWPCLRCVAERAEQLTGGPGGVDRGAPLGRAGRPVRAPTCGPRVKR